MKYAAAYFLIFFSGVLRAQTVQIQLRDAHTDLPVENAHLTVINVDTLFTLSNFEGIATFNVKTEDTLEITHLSYVRVRQKISGSEKLQKIYLTPANTDLEEVVVTGQASPTLASNAVRSIRVIDEARIQKQAAVNLKDLLANELNFRVSEDGILGSQISLQGLSGAKVKILIDGVPMIGRLDGNLDLSQINLNDIERVELVEGPMSVQYGTDAVAGTINLITKRKATANVSGEINTYYESVGRYNADATVHFPLKNWQANVSLGRNFFNGFDADENNRNVAWNPKAQYFGALGLKRRWGKFILRYRSECFYEQILNNGAIGSLDSVINQVDTGAWKYPRALDDRYVTQRINNSLYGDYFMAENMKVRAFIAYNYFRREKYSTIKNLSTGAEQQFMGADAQDTSIFGQFSSRLFFEHAPHQKFSYQAGYDVGFEINQGQRIEGDIQNITDAAAFATADYKPNKNITLQPGLRYAYNSRFDAPLISSLATRLQLSKYWVARASYGQGFRAPSLKELYFLFVDENHNILGNEDLSAETSDNFQAGVTYNRNFKKLSLALTANGFFNNIENEIRLISVIDPSDNNPRGLFRNENIAQTQTTGGSLNAKATIQSFQAEAGASFIGVKNNLAFSETAQLASQNNFNFYPQYRVNISYVFKKIGLTPSLFLNHTGTRKDLSLTADGEIAQTTFSRYTLADFTLQKSFLKKKIIVSAGVKNMLNITDLQSNSRAGGGVHSAGSGSIPLSYGRSFFARLQFILP